MTTGRSPSEHNQRSASVHRLVTDRTQRWQALQDDHEREATFTQGALALSFPLASGVPAEPVPSSLTLVSRRPASVPAASEWATRFVQAVIEVVSSDRPLTQLLRWTDEQVYAEIGARQRRVAQRRSVMGIRPIRQHVASVHVCQPKDGTAEVSARITCGGRSRAVAARLEIVRDRWLCTAITFG